MALAGYCHVWLAGRPYKQGAHMIRNPATARWQRLSQKQLDGLFRNEVIRGLQCSLFEAQALLEAVYKVYGLLLRDQRRLAPWATPFRCALGRERPRHAPGP